MADLKTLRKGKPNQPQEEENARSAAFKSKRILHSQEEVKTWREERKKGFAVTFEESPIEGGKVEEVGDGVEEAGEGEGEWEGEDPGDVGEEDCKEEASVDAMVETAEVPPVRCKWNQFLNLQINIFNYLAPLLAPVFTPVSDSVTL